MADQEQPFVINDRRKFRSTGELRDDLPPREDQPPAEEPKAVEPTPEPVAAAPAPEEPEATEATEDALPPMPEPTAEELVEVQRAFEATADRLDTAIRASNLGAEHLPPMDFSRLVQSVYMTAMMQLGAGTQPGQKARVDIMGARNSIDMLKVLEEKTTGNLSDDERKLVANALFELRMAFLEITSALAQQAAAKTGGPGTEPGGGPAGFGGGPQLVR